MILTSVKAVFNSASLMYIKVHYYLSAISRTLAAFLNKPQWLSGLYLKHLFAKWHHLLAFIMFMFTCIFTSSCTIPQAPELSPLEKQQMQTREYENTKRVLFNSTLSVFQNEGFTVDSADVDTGFIRANSPSDFIKPEASAGTVFLGILAAVYLQQ